MKQSSFIQVTSRRRRRIGFTITELLTLVAAIAVALCLVIPAIGSVKSPSRVDQSLANLRTLFAAHQAYANDWAGRQVTFTVDGLGAHLNGLGSIFALPNGENHPPIVLGWGCEQPTPALWSYLMTNAGNRILLFPIHAQTRWGSFRCMNTKTFHDYVNGHVYEPTYYAPADGIVLETVTPLFGQPCEFAPSGSFSAIKWSSYIFSPAAFFHPNVLDRSNPQYPGSGPASPNALQPPALSHARYPDLKTHMIEHNWLQNAPIMCNPNLPNGGPYSSMCEPYYFNHAVASEPAVVFYDGHTRRLPNTECLAADALIKKQLKSVDGLWFSTGGALNAPNLADDGYFESIAFDPVEIRHTILTIDGILGRDTLANK